MMCTVQSFCWPRLHYISEMKPTPSPWSLVCAGHTAASACTCHICPQPLRSDTPNLTRGVLPLIDPSHTETGTVAAGEGTVWRRGDYGLDDVFVHFFFSPLHCSPSSPSLLCSLMHPFSLIWELNGSHIWHGAWSMTLIYARACAMALRYARDGSQICARWLTDMRAMAHRSARDGSQICARWLTDMRAMALRYARDGSKFTYT